jgi:FlaA1/EpsC-like NDP-sugar epimerase
MQRMKIHPAIRNRYILMGDLLLIIVAILGSYALRLELGPLFYFYIPWAPIIVIVSLLLKPIVYYLFGLYRRIWTYASTQELKIILAAVTTASLVISIVIIAMVQMGIIVRFPRAILGIDWLLSLIFVGGLRFTFRLLAENRISAGRGRRIKQAKQVLIIGAGDAGALVVKELQKNPQVNMQPVGFLDDDPSKLKHQIYGVPVIGALSDLARILDLRAIDEVVIAIPTATGRVIRMAADVCRLKGIPFRTMPGIYELLGGRVSVNRLREVDIADLLRREPARINEEMIGASLNGKVVLVTGAGGSIGRELCRQIARWGPAELVLLGHGENSIFEALIELQEGFPSLPLRPIIADIRDMPRLKWIFNTHRPQVVFHAAAHKHVPLMEINIEEAITNNVLGTLNVVEISLASCVQRLVMISTDKAIRPANVMGATKRMAEMLVLDAAKRSGKAFSVVRFGNVLGSRGSVVPLFKRQIARGGPVTLTHPDMRRYFMTIPEAVHLVLQASSMGQGGETFVLNMGQQIRILDLAEDLIRLSGLEPGRDIEIVFTGIRPGEKLSEDLWDEGYSFIRTPHPDILRIGGQDTLNGEALQKTINKLIQIAQSGDSAAVVTLLDEIIPGSAVRSMPPPEITSIE